MARATISTHVLDTAFGKPRAGVRVVVQRGPRRVGEGTTDDDGRIGELAKDLEPGAYELVFTIGGPFFEQIALTVNVDEGHYHVPLLLSPFGAATYRGS
ncbi:MAG TPA: hydroxyisourate hydrolase [Candidatus Limnocylindria bacterium]|nr:hydroxyisourate hydrolase [Candidatus Limnocylindria bacterium]